MGEKQNGRKRLLKGLFIFLAICSGLIYLKIVINKNTTVSFPINKWDSIIKHHCDQFSNKSLANTISNDEYEIYQLLIDKYRAEWLEFKVKDLNIEKSVSGICAEKDGFDLDADFAKEINIPFRTADNYGSGAVSDRGYVKLFRVAFNVDYTEACASFDYTCGAMCGFRTYIILQKIDGKWVYDQEFTAVTY